MYLIWFLHRVPKTRDQEFLALVHRAIEVFARHGALGGTVMEMADPAAKYGCSAVDECIEVAEDEVLYAELAYFRDRAHYDEVMPSVDADPELESLYESLVSTIDLGRVARGEFRTLFEIVDEEARDSYQRTPRKQWTPVSSTR